MVIIYIIVDAHSEKIIENIIPDEPDDSNKLEQTIAILEQLVQPENSNNQLPINIEKKSDFSEKLENFLY